MKLRWDQYTRYDHFFYFSLMAKINSDDVKLKFGTCDDSIDHSSTKARGSVIQNTQRWYDKMDDNALISEIGYFFL